MNILNLPMYPWNMEQLAERIEACRKNSFRYLASRDITRFLLHAIDLTSLSGSDNTGSIARLCEHAREMVVPEKQCDGPAAVCVFPTFVKQAKQCLRNTAIRVASVAGAFPSGQSPIDIKVSEVRYAVQSGADEIDMVISRGKFLEGNYQEVFDEIAAIKNACGTALLKVILETGELKTPDLIYKASLLSMNAGADFIKTSTGKIEINATPEAFMVMLDAIVTHYKLTGKKIGIKPAGGIADTNTAILFLKILENVTGEEWLSNRLFRVGTTRLADKIFEEIMRE
ncbi:MAG: deoxyribose-phosphate aldolase [Bacteroidales bacterium]|jgi:deoxyribose-phosphate aldolase|nr:deoxyribose-phosphate aldolase [Bacteroidales bacterium]